jgi:formamidopyrimidine-DNA glycosylase
MPELPEVETIRRDLGATFAGLRIERVTVDGPRTLRRHAEPGAIPDRLAGHRLETVGRRGKYLLLHLDDGEVIVVHLGMSGQLLVADADVAVARHTHLIVAWEQGSQLRFVDPRTFGEIFVTQSDSAGAIPELAHLGFDPLEDSIGWKELARRLGPRRTKLKPLLMDQRFVAGIGNLYSDEILWSAGVIHDRPAADLASSEVKRIYDGMLEILRHAVRERGSSLADEQYRDLEGRIGGYQAHHRVYGRDDRPCERCGTTIVRVKAYGRSTWYCPRCQT